MPKQDFSEYEKRVSADHERQCRTTLTIYSAWRVCPIRKCRRDKACSGEMRVSAHQDRKIRAQREIGLSGNACAKLPRCMATASALAFETFAECLDNLQGDLIAHPYEDLPKFDRCLKGRQPRRDTANP
jgi:hypothetical protein